SSMASTRAAQQNVELQARIRAKFVVGGVAPLSLRCWNRSRSAWSVRAGPSSTKAAYARWARLDSRAGRQLFINMILPHETVRCAVPHTCELRRAREKPPKPPKALRRNGKTVADIDET